MISEKRMGRPPGKSPQRASQTAQMYKSTLETLRQIKAVTGEATVEITDRLAKAELDRLTSQNKEQ